MTAALTGYASRSWAALREASSNPSIRLVVLAYIVFTVSKWALRPRASFGEIALIRGLPCPATVRTTTSVTAYRLSSADFLSAVTGHPHSATTAEQVIADPSAPDWA